MRNSRHSDNAVDYCIPLNPWQETGNTDVQSKVKLQEVRHHKMIECLSNWCSCNSQSSSVRERSLLQWALKFILMTLPSCSFSLIVPQNLGHVFWSLNTNPLLFWRWVWNGCLIHVTPVTQPSHDLLLFAYAIPYYPAFFSGPYLLFRELYGDKNSK